MKKLFLLLAAGSIAMNVGAQERKPIAVDGPQKMNFEKMPNAAGRASLTDSKYLAVKTAGGARKTTGVGSRWYDYSVYLNLKSNLDRLSTGTQFLDSYNPLMWNDTLNMISFINGTTYSKKHTTLVSLGMVIRPQFAGFNRTDLFGTGSMMRVKTSEAYTVDSVTLNYFYSQGTKAALGHKDTVRLAFIIGDGSSSSSIFTSGTTPGGHYASGTKFPDVAYDSVLNVAVGRSPGLPAQYMDVIFNHNTDTSVFSKSVAMAIKNSAGVVTPLTVPAGNFVAVMMSYKSGDPAAVLQSLPGDTLAGVGGRYYDLFQPFVDYVTTDDPSSVANTNPDWIIYDSTDYNAGLYKQLPNTDPGGWKNIYIPNWAWSGSTPSGAFYYGYPDVAIHVTCPTCSDVPLDVKTAASVSSISAVPNPANNEVNINFSLVEAANVSVSLTNIVGQVVATQNISNTASGKATFNTTALPAGVYVYTLKANGEISTGRVVVAH